MFLEGNRRRRTDTGGVAMKYAYTCGICEEEVIVNNPDRQVMIPNPDKDPMFIKVCEECVDTMSHIEFNKERIKKITEKGVL